MITTDVTRRGLCRRYLSVVIIANLLWEFVQMPLYALWERGTFGQIVGAGLHCTAGDTLIASASLFALVLLFGSVLCPSERYWQVIIPTVVLGILVTIWSEWFNVYVIGSWSYSQWMPTLSIFGSGKIGVSPIAQWTVLPTASFAWLRRERWGGASQLRRRGVRFLARLSIKR